MAIFTPDQPWLYLLIYGSFMVFVLTFGLILALTQRNKKKKQEAQLNTNKEVNV